MPCACSVSRCQRDRGVYSCYYLDSDRDTPNAQTHTQTTQVEYLSAQVSECLAKHTCQTVELQSTWTRATQECAKVAPSELRTAKQIRVVQISHYNIENQIRIRPSDCVQCCMCGVRFFGEGLLFCVWIELPPLLHLWSTSRALELSCSDLRFIIHTMFGFQRDASLDHVDAFNSYTK